MSLENSSNKHIKEESFQDNSKKVDVNDLIDRLKREESKDKKNNVILSAAAISAVAVFGIILTL
tara:strand:+ start:280 stop:471 length:192 start_codon:yes stop_codon:yes gene_type:complete